MEIPTPGAIVRASNKGLQRPALTSASVATRDARPLKPALDVQGSNDSSVAGRVPCITGPLYLLLLPSAAPRRARSVADHVAEPPPESALASRGLHRSRVAVPEPCAPVPGRCRCARRPGRRVRVRRPMTTTQPRVAAI